MQIDPIRENALLRQQKEEARARAARRKRAIIGVSLFLVALAVAGATIAYFKMPRPSAQPAIADDPEPESTQPIARDRATRPPPPVEPDQPPPVSQQNPPPAAAPEPDATVAAPERDARAIRLVKKTIASESETIAEKRRELEAIDRRKEQVRQAYAEAKKAHDASTDEDERFRLRGRLVKLEDQAQTILRTEAHAQKVLEAAQERLADAEERLLALELGADAP